MNTKNYGKLLLVGTMLLGLKAPAFAEISSDHRGGNGGISMASEFSMVAKNVEIIWEDICTSSGAGEKNYCDYLQDYKELLNKNSDRFVKVLTSPDVTGYDGQPREAINNGVDEIVVNSRLWDSAKQVRLVIHEYTSILQLDSSDFYGFTNELISLFSRKKYDLSKITGKQILPHRCSLNFSSTDFSGTKVDSIAVSMGRALAKKSYQFVSNTEFARFQVRMYTACESQTLSKTCGMFVQLIDLFKNQIVKSAMEVDNQMFTSSAGVLEDLGKQIAAGTNVCK